MACCSGKHIVLDAHSLPYGKMRETKKKSFPSSISLVVFLQVPMVSVLVFLALSVLLFRYSPLSNHSHVSKRKIGLPPTNPYFSEKSPLPLPLSKSIFRPFIYSGCVMSYFIFKHLCIIDAIKKSAILSQPDESSSIPLHHYDKDSDTDNIYLHLSGLVELPAPDRRDSGMIRY